MKHVSTLATVALLGAMSVGVKVPARSDSSLAGQTVNLRTPEHATPFAPTTTLEFGAGGGDYAFVIRDCSGDPISATRQPFKDAAVGVLHELSPGLSVGARGGYVEYIESEPFYYVNPHMVVEGANLGFGVGVLISQSVLYAPEDVFPNIPDVSTFDRTQKTYPTFHARIGKPELNMWVSFMEGMPLYSSGGPWRYGVGVQLSKKWDLSAFTSAGFYGRPGVGVGLEYELTESLRIRSAGRYGDTFDVTEWGASGGLEYDIRWK